MKRILFLSVCSVFMVFIFGYAQIEDADYILKGKTVKDALDESVAQWGGGIFDDSVTIPIVVVATAEEDAFVPNPKDNEVHKQKFSIEEEISGDTDSECIFTYAVFPSHGERAIKKQERILGILKKYKAPGEYMLLSAITHKDQYKKEILENLSAASNIAKKEDGVSEEEAMKIAEEVCKEEDWDWVQACIYDRETYWEIMTYCRQDGGNAFILINKKDGKIIKKFLSMM